jgi:hypothetical protein
MSGILPWTRWEKRMRWNQDSSRPAYTTLHRDMHYLLYSTRRLHGKRGVRLIRKQQPFAPLPPQTTVFTTEEEEEVIGFHTLESGYPFRIHAWAESFMLSDLERIVRA